MRAFSDLSDIEQEKAKQKIFVSLIEDICQGFVVAFLWPFQAQIEEAADEAERLQTPWFFAEILLDKIANHARMKKAVDAYVSEVAQGSLYAEAGENIILL
jgi:hypothetical protein